MKKTTTETIETKEVFESTIDLAAAKAGEISSAALKRLGVSVECKKSLYVESKAA